MMRIALIRNPLSRRNAGGARPLSLPTAEPHGSQELRHALAGFRAHGTEVVAVDGGDGTVREVMTALVEMDWFPRLAILPGGNTNLIARDVGFPRRHALTEDKVQIQRRRLLRLDHAGGTSYGMFLGAAGFRLAWELANRHLRRLSSAATIVAAMALTLGRAGGDAGETMSVRLDHGAPMEGRRFLLLATTLDSLMLGLWPFWGQGPGLRLLDIAAPPRRLLAALPALARGRPTPWMEESGYRSYRANRVELHPTGPVILDGEPFSPDPDGKLMLSLGPEMEFIRP
ncbi:MAG: hypothetical protein H7Z12_18790 [Rhodospirillaceae bacterium]|nr:hypothetical protein [Rhodospirillales bacterium]